MQFTHYSFLFLFLFSLLLQSITAFQSSKTLDEFIKKSCQVSRYSELCYSSLSSSYTGDPDLGKLSYAAIRISLDQALDTAHYVDETSTSSKTSTSSSSSSGAEELVSVRDCMELSKDAVHQVKKSLDQMARVLREDEVENSRKRRFEMSNVQTWMSAAITDQDTCVDGFSQVHGGKLQNQLTAKVEMLLKFISNALALVNYFVQSSH
ncbi:hypothetical protein BVRB_6g139440 [Beta vulgaris subsp. vulgaris]|nr:hypothetical protein BVRB_6g139440 [Beta vulgaris subsp. vulgaris]